MLTFNNAIQVFPAVLIAGTFGFTKREFFEIEDAADREVPTVSFQPDAPAAPAAPPAGDAPAPPSFASALLAAALAALALAGAADAKSFSLPQADVSVQVAKDGSLVVDELITYSFSGPFSGGYRDIPLRKGESIDGVRVSENGRAYRPGGCTRARLRRRRRARSERPSSATRCAIVWHYQASDELRTFAVHYRLRGVAVAYDDVVDVNLQVWGSEWEEPLGRLTATETRARQDPHGLGPPRLRARRRPARGQARAPAGAERARRPVRRASHRDPALGVHARPLGMRVASGNGLAEIVAEETADAARFEKDSERIENAKQHPWRYALYLLLARHGPGVPVVGGVFWFYGRELETGYDREYEQEPPTDTEPALVPTLLRQGGEAGSFEFTATLFDLIRRGVFTSTPVTTERCDLGRPADARASPTSSSRPGSEDESLTALGELGRRSSSTA